MAKDIASYFLEEGQPIVPKPKPKQYLKSLEALNTKAAVNTLSPKTYTNLVGQISRKAFDNKEISASDYYNTVMPLFGETGEMVTEKIEQYDAELDRYADGGRVNFSKGTMKIKDALQQIVSEKGTDFKNQKQLLDLVENKVGYKPNLKILRPSKYPILKNVNYDSSTKPYTEKELKNILGDNLEKLKNQGVSDKKIRELASSKKQYINMSDEQKAKKFLQSQAARIKRESTMTSEQKENARIKNNIRMQKQRGTVPKYHRGRDAKSLLWSDLIRAAGKNDYLTFKDHVPESNKIYGKSETEKIVLVDKQGNEFKFNNIENNIKNFTKFKPEDVLRPYEQREFLNKEGLTTEINKAAGIEPGSRRSIFNIQHTEGIAKNPFNVQLTFADQNIAEAGARRTFDAEWKASENSEKKLIDRKKAVKKYYSKLGPDIVGQIGKKPKGTAPTLESLIDKTGYSIGDNLRKKARALLFKPVEGLVENYKKIRPGIDKATQMFPGKADNAIAAAIDFPMMYMSGAPALEAAGSAASMFINKPNVGKAVNLALESSALSDEEKFLKRGTDRREGIESMLQSIPSRFKETINQAKGIRDETEEYIP